VRAANGSAFLSVRRLVFSRCPRDQNLTPLSHSQDADSQFETRCLIVKTDPPQLLNETRPIRGNRLGPPHNLVNLHIDAKIRMLHKRPCETLSCDNSLFFSQCVCFLDQIRAQSSERRAKGTVGCSSRQPNAELCLVAQASAFVLYQSTGGAASASQNLMAARAARALRNISAAWRPADGNPRLSHSRCT
jgi:hypothetical protein